MKQELSLKYLKTMLEVIEVDELDKGNTSAAAENHDKKQMGDLCCNTLGIRLN